MIDLSKVELFFRPIIKYTYTGSATQNARLALLGVTPIDSNNCFFTL
jgi:hypothetical protein